MWIRKDFWGDEKYFEFSATLRNLLHHQKRKLIHCIDTTVSAYPIQCSIPLDSITSLEARMILGSVRHGRSLLPKSCTVLCGESNWSVVRPQLSLIPLSPNISFIENHRSVPLNYNSSQIQRQSSSFTLNVYFKTSSVSSRSQLLSVSEYLVHYNLFTIPVTKVIMLLMEEHVHICKLKQKLSVATDKLNASVRLPGW